MAIHWGYSSDFAWVSLRFRQDFAWFSLGSRWHFAKFLLGGRCFFAGVFTFPTYTQSIPKILENFTSPPSKTHAKTSQNRAQEAPKSRFGGGPLKIRFGARSSPLLGGRLGAPWGRPGGVLGASWARLGAVLGVLGRLRRVLGLSWDVLGRISLPSQLESDF